MSRRFSFILAALFVSGITDTLNLDGVSQTKPKPTQASEIFKVKTELMEVRAVVSDPKGRIVENLQKEDFELLENDRTTCNRSGSCKVSRCTNGMPSASTLSAYASGEENPQAQI